MFRFLHQFFTRFLRLPYNNMSSTELGYPEESFPTLKPAFVIKAVGIKEKFPVGNVWTGGNLIAVVCLSGEPTPSFLKSNMTDHL